MRCECCGQDKSDALARALTDAGHRSIQTLCTRCASTHDSHRWLRPSTVFVAPLAVPGKKSFGTFKKL